MKKIMIIGAGFLQAYVIKRAKELGYYTICVDGNPNADGFAIADKHAVINIVDKEACLKYSKSQKIDGVLTAATDYGVLTASYIAREMGLPSINYESAKLVKNKYQVRKTLLEAKADDTQQAYEINEKTDIDKLSREIIYPVMVKPCDGSGSRGASRVDSSSELKPACIFACSQSHTNKALVESFIIGQEYGVEAFVYKNKVNVLAIMKKKMTQPPYYAELGHSMPCGLTKKMQEKVTLAVTKAINALGINFGAVNMDLLINDDNIHIVDIGARMGGNLIGSHIVPLGTGVDYMGNLVRAAVGDAVDMSDYENNRPVATRLLALDNGVIKSVPDFKAISSKYNVLIEHHLKIGDTIMPYRTNLDGCGYVVALAESISQAEEKAQKVKDIINCAIIRE